MYKVIDSNILLLQAYHLVSLGSSEATIVVPETVIDEIDSKKSGLGELAYQAREFGRLLTRATRGVPISLDNGLDIIPMDLDGTTIWVASTKVYPSFTSLESNIVRDRKIITIALKVQEIHSNTVFISNDVMCVLRAESLGLPSETLELVDKTEFEFTKEMVVDHKLLEDIDGTSIHTIDVHHLVENYNYILRSDITNRAVLCTVHAGVINVITKDIEKELHRQDVNPINSGQLFLASAIQDTRVDIVVCEALAGAGKSLCSISNAIRLVRRGAYNSILYVRASVDDVPKEEEIGFLSGNDEKMAVYLHPLEDSLAHIVRSRHKKQVDEEKLLADVEQLKSKCNIEGVIGLGMRGRTFTDTIMIIDECQNMSKASLQKVLTRVGKNSKVILIGSNRQIDNPYISKFNNGLSSILEATTKLQDTISIHAVDLNRVVRGNIAEFAEKLFSK